jgi:hypothetical protein
MGKVRFTRIWCIIAMISIIFCFQGVAWADNISLAVQNPSFEADTLAAGTWNASITGWSVTGVTGTWYPTGDYFPIGSYYEAVPDGNQIAYSNGGLISQTLTDILLPNTGYILKVDVGSRADTPFPGYTVALYAGENLLASDGSVIPARGYWQEIDVPFMSTATTAGIGENLKIVLTSFGAQTTFDNVRLDDAAIPIPPSAILLGSGLLGLVGLGGWRRRSRKS